MERLLEELCQKDATNMANLIDIRNCSSGACRQSSKCACPKCQLYQAAGLTASQDVMALQINVLFPITCMETVYALADEIVADGAAKLPCVLRVADDIIKSLSEFLEYRFPP